MRADNEVQMRADNEVPSFWAKFDPNCPFAPKGDFFRKCKFTFVNILCPVMLYFIKNSEKFYSDYFGVARMSPYYGKF